MPGSSCEVVADHADAMQIGRPVADQHGALDRRADLAVLDLVGLGALEHVFARGDVDLAAAEVDGVKAVLHRGDDFLRVVRCRRACRCWSCAASAHGRGFAPAVAGRLHAHQPRVLPVLHVADKDAVLDQHGAVGRRALVVDRQRAAPRAAMVPSSTTVTPLAATCWPIRPAKAEVFLRLKSPSRPWPTASCSMTPGQPEPSTTSISPAGRGHRIRD